MVGGGGQNYDTQEQGLHNDESHIKNAAYHRAHRTSTGFAHTFENCVACPNGEFCAREFFSPLPALAANASRQAIPMRFIKVQTNRNPTFIHLVSGSTPFSQSIASFLSPILYNNLE
jgi:hypothetical protein